MRSAMNAVRLAAIRALGITSATCRPRLEVRLKVPRLRQQTFETAIIERYRRRESSVEEALIEMYLAGVSVRRVEDMRRLFKNNQRHQALIY
jgi:transposase-like protein